MLDTSFAELSFELARLAIVIAIVFVVFLKMTTNPHPEINVYPSERFYSVFDGDGKEGKREFRKSLEEAADDNGPAWSIVIPAYNEEQRLPVMLEDALSFLNTHNCEDCRFSGPDSFEIIVVDDGSKDGTTERALKYAKTFGPKFKVLTLAKNLGKGGAVRRGMMVAGGKYVMFVDADGATTFSETHKAAKKLFEIQREVDFAGQTQTHGLVCGSRAHLEKESVAKRSLFRTVLMYGFHACVSFFGCGNQVKDTQCGFKLMTRDTARAVFYNLHIERWAFDVEMVKIAVGYVVSGTIPVAEIAVEWREIDGSKLEPLTASVQMFKDIFLLWLRYAVGAWRVKTVSFR